MMPGAVPSIPHLTGRLAVPLLLLWISVSGFAQATLSTTNKKAIEMYTEADNYRVRRQFPEALQLLTQAINKDKNFTEAYFRQALIYKTMKDFPRSTEVYLAGLNVTNDPKKQKGYFFELGENYLLMGDYEKSLSWIDRYLESEILNKAKLEQANRMKRNAQYAVQNKKMVSQFQPHPLSDTVNAFAMQYFPVLTADENELIFTRRLGARDTDDEDLVVSRKNDRGRWAAPVSISNKINSPLNEGTCTISADGRQLIFTSCIGRRGYGSCDLFQSIKVGEEWTTPVNMGPEINSAAWESQPSLSADGRMLFFVSDRRGGEGNKDLYVSYKLDENKWTKAENLGDQINSPYEEMSPFIHVNGRTLFFASNGRPGFGGFDVYKSERSDGKWSEPENFGYPVNNHEDQFSLFITANGEHGFYSHEDSQKPNSSRIIEITVPDELRLRYKSNYVKGVILDRKTKLPLKARVELFNISRNELTSVVQSDSMTGEYLMVLTQGADYGLYVSQPGYLFQSEHFNYEAGENLAPVRMDVLLEPIETGAFAILNNLFFDLNKYELKERSITELDKVVRFLSDNPKVKVEISGHTDNAGTAVYNQQLSLKRAQSVASYLSSHGIDPARLKQVGYGADKPLKPNDTEENRQANRRIEFRIIR